MSWGHISQSFSISLSPKILTNGSMAGSGVCYLNPFLSFPPHNHRSPALCSLSTAQHTIHTLISTQPIDTDRRMKLRAKGLGLLLLLVLLALCSTIEVSEARRGKHWRSSRSSPGSSQLKKGKGKKSSSRRQHGSNRPSPKPPVSSTPSSGAGKGNQSPYQPSPNAPDMPRPSPANGTRYSTPKPPTPSCGKGHEQPSQPPPATSQGAVFNVVDFGAKGDGVTDDTKVNSFALQMFCFKQNSIIKLSSIMHSLSHSSCNSFRQFAL
jgi:hypothetical protein